MLKVCHEKQALSLFSVTDWGKVGNGGSVAYLSLSFSPLNTLFLDFLSESIKILIFQGRGSLYPSRGSGSMPEF